MMLGMMLGMIIGKSVQGYRLPVATRFNQDLPFSRCGKRRDGVIIGPKV